MFHISCTEWLPAGNVSWLSTTDELITWSSLGVCCHPIDLNRIGDSWWILGQFFCYSVGALGRITGFLAQEVLGDLASWVAMNALLVTYLFPIVHMTSVIPSCIFVASTTFSILLCNKPNFCGKSIYFLAWYFDSISIVMISLGVAFVVVILSSMSSRKTFHLSFTVIPQRSSIGCSCQLTLAIVVLFALVLVSAASMPQLDVIVASACR